uniref:Uncharacterized protein n=1 Tax=Chromera velia CCMP2878 TaxID=1169474 RepID=A0A0G4HGW3_9ALVE|eukprot:Cvel_6803.t1-p1 / transcript=Cvel_6803.t1 / gene=Cvel_6803 / organism=Chromera_velia_CCMP2878 / gene_product=hypothetical protein / transcript_product=hypothetical protein / location=Cvel_scaffold342:73829-77544(+) / protein_length=419 / sequence_SO=supercontig / SO=protein_coding / is_pseudo=false
MDPESQRTEEEPRPVPYKKIGVAVAVCLAVIVVGGGIWWACSGSPSKKPGQPQPDNPNPPPPQPEPEPEKPEPAEPASIEIDYQYKAASADVTAETDENEAAFLDLVKTQEQFTTPTNVPGDELPEGTVGQWSRLLELPVEGHEREFFLLAVGPRAVDGPNTYSAALYMNARMVTGALKQLQGTGARKGSCLASSIQSTYAEYAVVIETAKEGLNMTELISEDTFTGMAEETEEDILLKRARVQATHDLLRTVLTEDQMIPFSSSLKEGQDSLVLLFAQKELKSIYLLKGKKFDSGITDLTVSDGSIKESLKEMWFRDPYGQGALPAVNETAWFDTDDLDEDEMSTPVNTLEWIRDLYYKIEKVEKDLSLSPIPDKPSTPPADEGQTEEAKPKDPQVFLDNERNTEAGEEEEEIWRMEV